MISNFAVSAVLVVAAIPFVYYLIVVFSSWRFFSRVVTRDGFTPPVSILKPIRGLDPEAYENFASFCRQDYPEYELLFCVDQTDLAVVQILEKIVRDFPERRVRILFGSGSSALNDKVAKLGRLVREARNEIVIMGDSDVRVAPDYLRTVVAPLVDPHVGATTCFYVPAHRETFAENLQTVGMISDFYAGLLVGWQLEGIRFGLGPSIATSRARLADFGGLEAIENQPGDDLLVGRLIAEHGHRVELLPYTVKKLAGCHSLRELVDKRLRWMVVMRHMRPWGHLGLLLTQGLLWVLVAIAVRPSVAVGLAYVGAYFLFRILIAWSIGVRGLRQGGFRKDVALIPVWDGFAFFIWVRSFFRRTIRWRDGEYFIRGGLLISVGSVAARK
jgi:ceramide glucosyltransferase